MKGAGTCQDPYHFSHYNKAVHPWTKKNKPRKHCVARPLCPQGWLKGQVNYSFRKTFCLKLQPGPSDDCSPQLSIYLFAPHLCITVLWPIHIDSSTWESKHCAVSPADIQFVLILVACYHLRCNNSVPDALSGGLITLQHLQPKPWKRRGSTCTPVRSAPGDKL